MLKEKIKKDFKKAFKNKEKGKVSVLKMLKTDITKKEKNKRYQLNKEKDLNEEELAKESSLTDEEIYSVINSKIKQSKKSIEEFEKGDRQDLVKKEKKEIKILKKYLPEQLSEEELTKIIKKTIDQLGAKGMQDMGKVMPKVMEKVKGKAPGSKVSK